MKTYLSILLIEEDYHLQKLFLDVVYSVRGINLCNVAGSSKAASNLLKLMYHLPDIIFLGFNISLKNAKLFLKKMKSSVSTKHIPVIFLSEKSIGKINNGTTGIKMLSVRTNPSLVKTIKKSLESHLYRLQEERSQQIQSSV